MPGYTSHRPAAAPPTMPAGNRGRGGVQRPDLDRQQRAADEARHRAVLEALAGLGFNLETLATVASARRLEATDPEPDVLLVRHLNVEHLGRWIYLPGRPAQLGAPGVAEPSLAATAGRLVGIRPGKAGTRDTPGTRTLIVQAGTLVGELPVRVDDRVDVAPREWSL